MVLDALEEDPVWSIGVPDLLYLVFERGFVVRGVVLRVLDTPWRNWRLFAHTNAHRLGVGDMQVSCLFSVGNLIAFSRMSPN